MTNLRLVFIGQHGGRDLAWKKILAIQLSSVKDGPDSIELSVQGRQKNMIYEVPNSMIALTIARYFCNVSNGTE